MKKIYCCRCNKEAWEEVEGYVLLLENAGSFDEAVKENFSLCGACREEFVKEFMHKEIEEPHRITTEEDLLTKASREDVCDFMQESGIVDDMAFFISERVRKGLVASGGWREDMLDAMNEAEVPAWFFDACKKIRFLSRRDCYRPPYLIDDNRPDVKVSGVSILSERELEKNKDLIRVRRPFWCQSDNSSDQPDRCGVIIGFDFNGARTFRRDWGSVYPLLILEKPDQLEPGSKLLYAGEEFIVLRDGLALCETELLHIKASLMQESAFEQTPLAKMLEQWFEDNGNLAQKMDDTEVNPYRELV